MINPLEVMSQVTAEFHLSSKALVRPGRQKTVANARAVAMYLMRQVCDQSYPEIGDYFERDHATVMHNCKRIEKLMKDSGGSLLMCTIIKLSERLLGVTNG